MANMSLNNRNKFTEEDSKDKRDNKEVRHYKEGLDYKEERDYKEVRDYKEGLDYKEERDYKEVLDYKDERDYKEVLDYKKERDYKEGQVIPLCKLPTPGYDYKFVEEINPSDLCGICHLVVREAVQCGNLGHSFCKDCLDCWLSECEHNGVKLRCPMDNQEVSRDRIVNDHKTRRFVRNLQIFCENREFGCNDTFRLGDLDDHKTRCFYRLVTCPLSCQNKIHSWSLESHLKNECLNRTVKCTTCSEHFIARDMPVHERECPAINISCEYCGSDGIKQSEMPDHLRNCLEFFIPCPYAYVGCPVQVKRIDLKSHEKCCLHYHLDLMKASNDKNSKNDNITNNEILDQSEDTISDTVNQSEYTSTTAINRLSQNMTNKTIQELMQKLGYLINIFERITPYIKFAGKYRLFIYTLMSILILTNFYNYFNDETLYKLNKLDDKLDKLIKLYNRRREMINFSSSVGEAEKTQNLAADLRQSVRISNHKCQRLIARYIKNYREIDKLIKFNINKVQLMHKLYGSRENLTIFQSKKLDTFNSDKSVYGNNSNFRTLTYGSGYILFISTAITGLCFMSFFASLYFIEKYMDEIGLKIAFVFVETVIVIFLFFLLLKLFDNYLYILCTSATLTGLYFVLTFIILEYTKITFKLKIIFLFIATEIIIFIILFFLLKYFVIYL